MGSEMCIRDSSISHLQLIAAFEQFGVVEKAYLPLHRGGPFDGESRGFAFVEMADARAAQAAIDTLDLTTWRGVLIKVSIARSPTKPSHARERTHSEAEHS